MATLRRFLAPLLAFACTLLVCLPVAGQTVYKLIDRNGKVTYTQDPPKYFDGQVIRIDIDPNANKATLPKLPPKEAAPRNAEEEASRPQPQPPSLAQRREAARTRLEEARKALAEARDNPREGELRFLGKVGGGSRPVPTEEYEQRLAGLERAVKEAQDELHKLENGN